MRSGGTVLVETNELSGKRILTVDDSRAVRVFVMQLLEDHGAHLKEASSGEEALAIFEADGFDLVLLDLMLPDMD
jgi:CheY-like chemotaxis protein